MLDIVLKLKFDSVILSTVCENAMRAVDRKDFYSGKNAKGKDIYEDEDQKIGYSATISSISMHAWIIEYCNEYGRLVPGSKVLDVGCGTGFLCAAFYEAVKDPHNLKRTAVVGIEHIDKLADQAISNLKK